jgi:valyl-tRNA synthetase
VIDPLEVMDTFGADALRFTLAALSAMGRDIRLSEERLVGYRNFMNKIWNAARFVLMHVGEGVGVEPIGGERPAELGLAERWILSRLARTASAVRRALDEYRFNEAAAQLYQFTWHEFCDWYVEASKVALEGGDGEAKEAARRVLATVLDTVLRLLHPFIPFLTEEIWQALRSAGVREGEAPGTKTIMLAPYPEPREEWTDEEAERRMELLMGVVRAVRNIRAETNLPPARELPAVLLPLEDGAEETLRRHEPYLRRLGKVSEVRYQAAGQEKPRGAATAVVQGAEIYVPLYGLIDFGGERRRLEREIAKVREELSRVRGKLADGKFRERAPEAVVERERDKASQMEEKERTLAAGLERLRQLESA